MCNNPTTHTATYFNEKFNKGIDYTFDLPPNTKGVTYKRPLHSLEQQPEKRKLVHHLTANVTLGTFLGTLLILKCRLHSSSTVYLDLQEPRSCLVIMLLLTNFRPHSLVHTHYVYLSEKSRWFPLPSAKLIFWRPSRLESSSFIK